MTEPIVARPGLLAAYVHRGAHRPQRGRHAAHVRPVPLRVTVPTRAIDLFETWLVRVAVVLAVGAVLVLAAQLDLAQVLAGGGLGAAAVGRPGRALGNALHPEPHRLAGQTVTLNLAHEGLAPIPAGAFRVEDWWDRIAGVSWQEAAGNAAALKFAVRNAFGNLPVDDEVVYGKDAHGMGHIIHVSELVEPSTEVPA